MQLRLGRYVAIAVLIVAILQTLSYTAFALVGAHSYTNTSTGAVFLGGDYIELGLSSAGSFGTDDAQPLPTGFYGTDGNTQIGMSTNPAGFGVSPDLRMDFFMPGSPEERWVAGYTVDGSHTVGSNAKLSGVVDIPDNVVTDQSSGDKLQAESLGTLNDNLQVKQIISFDKGDKFFRNDVTLKNVGSSTLDSVRYMRSFDPDNTVFQGGDYTTHNYIPYTFAAGDDKAVVIADTNIGGEDPVYAANGSYSPILFYSSDSRARVSTFGFGNGDPYDPSAYDSALPKGTDVIEDQAITIAFDVGTLAPGDEQTVSYYTSLDNRDFSEVLEDIQTSSGGGVSNIPNSGDANDDGTQDDTQPNVSGSVSPVNNKYVALQAGASCTVHDQIITSMESQTTRDHNYSYPAGLVNFSLTGCGAVGFTTTVTQYYYGLTGTDYVLRKYNPVTKKYTTITGATISNIVIDGQSVVKVSYDITDGGLLDQDGQANGEIVDPAGLAQSVVGAPNTGFSRALDTMKILLTGIILIGVVIATKPLWKTR